MTKANFYAYVTVNPGCCLEEGGRCRADHPVWRGLRNAAISTPRPGDPTTSHLPRSPHEVEYTTTPTSPQRMHEGSQNM